tara:strand:- start:8215 stop:8736 length:522 start_codon:yes stop_codon:yes gene_type:complete
MPRCKNCKEKFEAKHFNQKYCFKSECVKVWVQTAKVKNWKKEKKRLKDELETVQSLTKKAQRYFNAYIRFRDKNKNCVSCDKKLRSKFDAGHYFSAGGHSSVRFNEKNVHGQCVACNQHKHGNLLNYQIGIEKRIGGDELLQLHQEAHQVKKYTRAELQDIIEKYKKKVRNKK